MNMQERLNIMDAANQARPTLNGKPATVNGSKNDFASVTNLATGESYQWSWQAVKRITEHNAAAFKS